MLRSLVLPVILIAGTLVQATAKKPVTIDTLMEHADAGPPPGPALWAPDGKRFVYRKGKQISLYDTKSRSQKELLSIEPLEKAALKPAEDEASDWQNRRVKEDSIAWSGDGKQLLLNVEGDLFLWSFDSGKWDQLTATYEAERDAKLSPDGKRVAYRLAHDLYSLDIVTKKRTRLTHDGSATLLNGELDWVYPEELEIGTAFWWSPDSQRIAYLQLDTHNEFIYPQAALTGLRAVAEPQRYPQAGTPNADARLGVVTIDNSAAPRTVWMDVGETRGFLLARVDWLPDGSRVAVQRMNRVQDRLDLLFADPSTGVSRMVLREADKYWVNFHDHLRFLLTAPEFLWSSERDGHRHLYRYSLDGKQLARLTAGDWDVTAVAAIDEASRQVYFVSTEASPLESQLYRVGFDGAGRARVSEGGGTHAISMSPASDFYLDRFSSTTTPPETTLHANDGKQLSVFRPADRKIMEEWELLPAENVEVRAADGTLFYGRVVKPANFKPGVKYPAVVMVYGGPHAQTVRNQWYGAQWEQVLAARGFVVWMMDNRGSSGRGHVFETPIYRRLGKTELSDQLLGVEHLISLGFVDPKRIGIYGWSYGGYMTLYSLLNAPDVFRAGIAGAPVTNWRNYDTIYAERYLGLPADNPGGYKDSSAITYASNLKAKLLLVHNVEDDNVLFQNTMQMVDALERAGKPFEMMLYPQKSHGVSGDVRRHLYEVTTEFFERTLK